MNHTGCIERLAAGFHGGTRGDDIVEQDHVPAAAVRCDGERSGDIFAPCPCRQVALLRRVATALEQIGSEAGAGAPAQLPPEQGGRVEAALDQTSRM